ncbi:5-oxoprolinase subunit PxpB [Aliiglaciecola sp. 2_MG-2023]|uniref:5-oxoprolinase subunit PxpB n=1 Tax=unclassified Aliiglaciecola TaxID=2593648 RepID=UPI0026E32D5A|nr:MULTISPECIES: 5-oxoprolinase subunit PxpB [unclassified Aliiglaciecola]MDO6712159.1 5-oxoprolinase subunit PxpB [Aliiglaciecola sp. 2_MG-2023]MDO6753239.1 5-oxoprolinase subunit PxpB [Aliiglaciecola sp. 1_MG-2023]
MFPIEPIKIDVASENALIVYFAGATLNRKNQQVSMFVHLLEQANSPWLLDVIPAYHSVLITFDILQTDYFAVKARIIELVKALKDGQTKQIFANQETNIVELPVCYGLSEDNDLQRIADHNQITVEQVIQLHQQNSYRVYCLGFSPGFAFLGETDEKIATPRLTTPRKQVPKGAVAIADRQTAVYPNVSPGGWNIVGVCPLALFVPERASPSPFKVGDTVRFKEISEHKYYQLLEANR